MHQVQPAQFYSIEVEPVVIHVKCIALKSVAQNQGPHGDTGEHLDPRNLNFCRSLLYTGLGILPSGVDGPQLLLVYAWIFFWPIGGVPVPYREDNEAGRGVNAEPPH